MIRKKVVIQLKPIYLPINLNDEELKACSKNKEKFEEMVRQQLMETLILDHEKKKKIKPKSIKVLERNLMDIENLMPGRVVKTVDNEIGIITRVSKKSSKKGISVILSGHRIRYYTAIEIFNTDATFVEARCIRFSKFRESGLWHEGDSAWIKVQDGYVPVIVGKIHRNKTTLHKVITNDEKPYSCEISNIHLNKYLKEFKSDSECNLYVAPDKLIEYYRAILDSNSSKLKKAELMTIYLKSIYTVQTKLYHSSNEAFKQYVDDIDTKFDMLLEHIYKSHSNSLPFLENILEMIEKEVTYSAV